MTPDSPLTEFKGVGENLSRKLQTLGLKTAADLINYYPRRYDDFSTLTPISQLKPGKVSIEAAISNARGRYSRRGLHLTEAIASDASGSLGLIWFNQPYRAASIKPDQNYFISGNYELSHRHFSLINPSIEIASELPLNTARILAVYRETKGLSSRQIRLLVQQVAPLIKDLPDNLPKWLTLDQKLISHAKALAAIHQPSSSEVLEQARYRLGFEEIFALSLASLLNKQANQSETALSVNYDPDLAVSFTKSLPFQLTDAQRLSVMRVYKDMAKAWPMNRLIEGDVGSGKTVVAVMAALMVLNSKRQAALMAPTELLARQHAETIHRLLAPLKLDQRVSLLIGSQSATQKKQGRQAIASGQAGFIIGTHALIQDQVDMHDLALIIIDEQHRFGVEQRKSLMAKAGHMPHVLSLTATPIPRSLALTLYGELDISRLDEKPIGRQPVQTEIITPAARARLYQKIDKQLAAGRQLYVVCPLIEDSELSEAPAAEKVYERLSRHEFKHRRIGLLHGRLKADIKQAAMQDFIERKLDVLVATTVIEVGVDVANATMMMIESAERFGLAQLHQLRGRVGRGAHQSYCYLMLSDDQPPTPRIRAMVSVSDGFRLAELDLRLRGPGAIYGQLQHGALDLRIAELSDTQLIAAARNSAAEFIERSEKLAKYPALKTSVNYLRSVTNLN